MVTKRSHHYLKKTINDFDNLPVFRNFVRQADARFSFDTYLPTVCLFLQPQ